MYNKKIAVDYVKKHAYFYIRQQKIKYYILRRRSVLHYTLKTETIENV